MDEAMSDSPLVSRGGFRALAEIDHERQVVREALAEADAARRATDADPVDPVNPVDQRGAPRWS